MGIKLSVVVPVYNSESILPRLFEEIRNVLEGAGYAGQYEVVLVNDHSPDKSWEVIEALSRKFDAVRGVSLRKNFGQHSATMAGLNEARGDVVVIMDDDLQHPPEAIPRLVEAIRDGVDVCYTRYIGRQHAAWKKLGSRFNDIVATVLLDKPRDLYLSSFKALSGKVVQEIIKYRGPYPYVDGLVLGITRNITVLDIHHRSRPEGAGNYNIRRSISLWLRMATSFSVVPLRLATLLGLLLAAAGILYGLYLAAHSWTAGSDVEGWAVVAAIILVVGGIQTFCVGLLGEYLGRNYLSVNAKPQYAVEHRTWHNRNGQDDADATP